MVIGLGDTTFGIPTSSASLYDCETSWNPLVGLQCILSGQIIQQVTSSVIPSQLTPGVFPVTSASDPNNPDVSSANIGTSGLSTLMWAGIIGIGALLFVKFAK